MLTFPEIREIIIQECKVKGACIPEFTKLKAAENETDFWTVIKNNAFWAHENGVISIPLFEKYDIEKLKENCIFIDSGSREIAKGTLAINYSGTVSENSGTVSYNGNSGTVSKNSGTVSKNSGTVSKNSGTVSENSGTVSENSGTVSENSGMGVYIERQNKKIYIKKSEFEIIYLD